MQLIADRFAADDCGSAIDLATGERVHLITGPAGGPSEQVAWAGRCAWLAQIAHPSLAPLVDYGVVGEGRRFESWGVHGRWSGSSACAANAFSRASQLLVANGRTPIDAGKAYVGAGRGERAVIVPDAAAGLPARDVEPESRPAFPACGVADDTRDLLCVVRPRDARLEALAESFRGQPSSRVAALAVWTPSVADGRVAVGVLARAARIAGYVPVAAPTLDARVATTLNGRTLVLFCDDDTEGGWRALLRASLTIARPHLVVFVGTRVVRRVHTVPVERHSIDALVASVCPAALAKRHVRHVMTAARRSKGIRGRFEQLLFGEPSGNEEVRSMEELRGRRVAVSDDEPARFRGSRVAEQPAPYIAAVSPPCSGPRVPDQDTWPAASDLTRLHRQIDAARALIARGRRQPGERTARLAMHALARRGQTGAAAACALTLAGSLADRGRTAAASDVVATAREWATRSRDLALLQEVGLLQARVQIDSGRLADAESLLESVLASALSSGSTHTADAILLLARCLFWQGRYAEAWQRLMLVPGEASDASAQAIRASILRSLVDIGRGKIAEALGHAARARDVALTTNDVRLRAEALEVSAHALAAAADLAHAGQTAARALQEARGAHDVPLVIGLRALCAEIARRQGNRAAATLLVRRIGRLARASLPVVVSARIDLLGDLLTSTDPAHAADRRVDLTGLRALRVFVPPEPPATSDASPAVDEIVELLQCCHAAEDDERVLAAVCARLRARLRAAGVGFFATDSGELVTIASDGARPDVAGARRVLAANQLLPPHEGGERVEAGVPVRYAGHVVGALVATWTPAASWRPDDVAVLMSTGAAAAGPALSAVSAKRAVDRHARTSDLLGVSAPIAQVRAAVERAAGSPFAVLVEGESGSGKELVARLVHKLSGRRDRPFCSLNCAALPEDLVESELFGHARGAFTGAAAERRGVFEEAHGGTLFLDEVGELSPRAQAKLLRAIQEGEIRRVGENVCRRVDVRLITATNRDLRAESAAGRFRLDLLYRLDVVRIAVPALRDRRDDIPLLAEHFWHDATERIGSRATLSAAVVAALARYDWPGNIRELQNVLASLAVRSPKRGVVPASALPPIFGERPMAATFRLDAARRTFDRAFIRAALVRAGGQRTRAAEELGLSRQGLAKLMTRLAIEDAVAPQR